MPAPAVIAPADPAIAAPQPTTPAPAVAQPSSTAAPAALDPAMAAQISRLDPPASTPEPPAPQATDPMYLTQLLDLALDALARVPTANHAAGASLVATAAHSIRRYLDLCVSAFRDADRDRLIVISRAFLAAVSRAGVDAESKAVAFRLSSLGLDVNGPIADAPTAQPAAGEGAAVAAIRGAARAIEAARAAPGQGRDAEIAGYRGAATAAAFDLRVAADAAGILVSESLRRAIVELSPATRTLQQQLDEVDQFVRASGDDHAAYSMLFQYERRLLETLGLEVPARAVGLPADAAQLAAAVTDLATKGGADGPPTTADEAVDRVLVQIEGYIDGMQSGLDIALAAITERVPAPEPSFLESAILYVADLGLNAATDGMWSMVKAAGTRVMDRAGGSKVNGALMWLIGHAGKGQTPKKPATAALARSGPALPPDAVRNDYAAGLRTELVDRAYEIRMGFSEARGPLEKVELAVLSQLVADLATADLKASGRVLMTFETISQWCRLKELIAHSDEHGVLQTPEIFNNGLNIAGSLQIDLLVRPEQPAAEPVIGRVALVGLEPGVIAFLRRQQSQDQRPYSSSALHVTKVYRLAHVLDGRESLVIVQRGDDIVINYMDPTFRALLAARVRGKAYPTWKSGGADYATDKSLATVSDAELAAAAVTLAHYADERTPLNDIVGLDSFKLP